MQSDLAGSDLGTVNSVETLLAGKIIVQEHSDTFIVEKIAVFVKVYQWRAINDSSEAEPFKINCSEIVFSKSVEELQHSLLTANIL